jgi:hypothetical protein
MHLAGTIPLNSENNPEREIQMLLPFCRLQNCAFGKIKQLAQIKKKKSTNLLLKLNQELLTQ